MFEVREIVIDPAGQCKKCGEKDTFFVIGDEDVNLGSDQKLCASCALKKLEVGAVRWGKYRELCEEALKCKLETQGRDLDKMIAMLKARIA